MQRIQKPQTSKTREQYLKELELRTKRNRGGFSASTEPTSSVAWREAGRRGQEPFAQKQAPVDEPFAPPPPPEEVVTPPTELPTQQPGQSASEFINSIIMAILNPGENASPQQLEFLYQTTGQEYPVATLPDGSVQMNTGRVVNSSETPAYPVASMADGGLLYSDGSTRYLPNGFMEAMFSNYQTTSEFGPREGFGLDGFHSGTDIVAGDKDLYFPLSGKVVSITQDDGTRFGDTSEHQGYGNSVIIELANGERLHFSHLANLGVNLDDTIMPGTYIGTEGSTGNSTGDHVDVEFYKSGSSTASPLTDFSIYTSPNDLISTEPIVLTPPEQPLYSQPQPTQQTQPAPTAPESTDPMFAQATMTALKPVTKAIGDIGEFGANTIDAWNPTGTVETGGKDYGMTELMRGDPKLALQKLGGTTANAINTQNVLPEAGVSEALRGNPQQLQENIAKLTNPFKDMVASARQAVGQGVENVGGFLGVPETGISEKIAGGPTRNTQPQAFAAESNGGIASGPNQNFTPMNQAGAGVSNMFSKPGLFSRPSTTDISPKLALGNVAPGGQNTQMASYQPGSQPNDIRDQFFKTGMAEQFKGSMVPNAETVQGGALTTDLFTPNFYENINNVSQVFGDTALKQQAIDLFKNQFKSKFGGADYDPQEVEAILAQINDLPQNMSINVPEPHKKLPTLESYIASGRPASQWYAETGQQSTLNQLRGNPQISFNDRTGEYGYNSGPNFSPAQTEQIGSQTGQGVRNMTYKSGGQVSTRPGWELRADSGGDIQRVESGPLSTPVKTPSAQLRFQPGLDQGIFQRIKNWFQRK